MTLLQRKIFTVVLSLFFIFSGLSAQEDQQARIKIQPLPAEIKAGEQINLKVKVNVEESWHINSNKPKEDFLIPTQLKISGSDKSVKLLSVKYPKSKDLKLGFSDTPLSVYEGEFIIEAVIKTADNLNPGSIPLKVELDYQSCNNATCMPPNTAVETIKLNIVKGSPDVKPGSDSAAVKAAEGTDKETEAASNNVSAAAPAVQTGGSDSGSLASRLESSGLFLSLLIVFLGGLALNLTPCVYPLIPITVGYFGGQSEGRTSKLFALGVLYVLGMALTYSVVGVITSLSGAVFGTLLQNTYVILGITAVLVALSLSMFGVYEFKLPDSLVAKAGGARGGYFGAFFMGLTIGIVAAPCIGPFVLGLVTYVGAKGDPWFGFLMFFTLAVGMGIPYLVLALFSGKIKNLPRAGFWMEAVKHIFGFVLLGMALYFLQPVLPGKIAHFVLPVYMILAAAYLILIDKAANNVKSFRIFKIVFSVLIFAVSIYMLLPEKKSTPSWQHYSDEAYTTSVSSSQPMIIDFYADWCIPCKELDAMTFSDPRVISESKRFGTYKVDMTKSLSPEAEKIRNKFKIVGMPTVLIINSKGEEIHRITGFENADKFYEKIKNVN